MPKSFAIRVCLLFGAGIFFAVAATWQFIPRNADENNDANLSVAESFDSTPEPATLDGETGISLSSFSKAGETAWVGSAELTIATYPGERESIIDRARIVSISDITKSFITAFDGTNLHSGLLAVNGTNNSVAGSFPMFGPSLGGSHSHEIPNAITSSATWLASPVDGDWNNIANWTSGGPPNGATDIASFGSSSITSISLSDPAGTTVGSIVFNSGASAFTIAASTFSLTIDGTGITNNSSATQNFTTAYDGINRGFIGFTGTATISSPGGGAIVITNNLGATTFGPGTNAGRGTFINNGSGDINITITGETDFTNTASAGSGNFTNNGATASGALPGFTNFNNGGHGGTATIISNGATVNGASGGVTNFGAGSTADGATLIANPGSNGGLGGTITFSSSATGGTPRVEVFGNGNLDIGLINQSPFSVTIGSLEGTGDVFLSNRNLTIGSNNSDRIFSGVIQDLGQGGFTGGSITKIGTGTQTLSGANTYTGGTTVSAGTLRMSGAGTLGSTSATLTVNGGALDLNGTNQTVAALNGTGGTIVNNNTSAFQNTLTVGQGNATGSYAGSIATHTGSGTGLIGLTKIGTGTETLTGNNTYTFTTTVNAGVLKLANPDGVALSGTSNIVVNQGGTLLMGANNQINQATLPGIALGTSSATNPAKLDAGGFSQGTGGTPAIAGSGTIGLGALTLNSSSIIDLTGTSVLHFSNSSSQGWVGTLSIYDWSGTPTTGGGAEQILFGSNPTGLSAGQLLQISFYSDNGNTLLSNTALILADGEIIPGPMAPIPEPSTWLAGALALGVLAWPHRRRFTLSRA